MDGVEGFQGLPEDITPAEFLAICYMYLPLTTRRYILPNLRSEIALEELLEDMMSKGFAYWVNMESIDRNYPSLN